MKNLVKQTNTYWATSEQEANAIVEECKENQLTKGYTVTKTKIDYKRKIDRKTGEIIDEKWVVETTINFEI